MRERPAPGCIPKGMTMPNSRLPTCRRRRPFLSLLAFEVFLLGGCASAQKSGLSAAADTPPTSETSVPARARKKHTVSEFKARAGDLQAHMSTTEVQWLL